MVLHDIQWVLAVDALTSSHPLSSEEDSIVLPGQISEQFDAISYSKVGRGELKPTPSSLQPLDGSVLLWFFRVRLC